MTPLPWHEQLAGIVQGWADTEATPVDGQGRATTPEAAAGWRCGACGALTAAGDLRHRPTCRVLIARDWINQAKTAARRAGGGQQ